MTCAWLLLQVSRALSEEIQRLYNLVDEFDRPFHSDPMFMDVYRKELHKHVENGLGKKIQARCSSELNEIVHVTEGIMTGQLCHYNILKTWKCLVIWLCIL